ncbi:MULTISPECIES: pilin [unclassified Duganella]|uniref:pilin n=1 Tax=unclassified Duganella TaxID=2636909 RepID=UPI000B7FC76E|nr:MULTISPECIES: pilin [unclassified Duganella]
MRSTSTSAARSANPPAALALVGAAGCAGGTVYVFPADLNYRGKAIAFTPRVDENKRVAWQCASEDIPQAILPPECRN